MLLYVFVISSVLFGKYRNRTESTKTEFPRFRFLKEIDRYLFSKEPNFCGNRSTEPIGSVLPNAQADVDLVTEFTIVDAKVDLQTQRANTQSNIQSVPVDLTC
jgi:hypothetical protein